MTKEEYQMALNTIDLFRVLLPQVDLEGFIQAIDSAEALAPILDPTLYRQYLYDSGSDYLDFMKRLAEALVPFQDEILKAIEAKGLKP